MKYIISPFVCVIPSGSQLKLYEPVTDRHYPVSKDLLSILPYLSRWRTRRQIYSRIQKRAGRGIEFDLDESVKNGILLTDRNADVLTLFKKNYWDSLSFAMHLRLGSERTLRYSKSRPPAPIIDWKGSKPLPKPNKTSEILNILRMRKSIRNYSKGYLSLDHLSAFLDSTIRIRSIEQTELGPLTLRCSPSGGARHSLEAVIVANMVKGLKSGFYRYNALTHGLAHLRLPRGARLALNKWSWGGAESSKGSTPTPHVLILLTTVPCRTLWKYDSIGYQLILEDLGCMFQTMYIAATALGLAPCAVGGGPQLYIDEMLGLDSISESFVGAFALGLPFFD